MAEVALAKLGATFFRKGNCPDSRVGGVLGQIAFGLTKFFKSLQIDNIADIFKLDDQEVAMNTLFELRQDIAELYPDGKWRPTVAACQKFCEEKILTGPASFCFEELFAAFLGPERLDKLAERFHITTEAVKTSLALCCENLPLLRPVVKPVAQYVHQNGVSPLSDLRATQFTIPYAPTGVDKLKKCTDRNVRRKMRTTTLHIETPEELLATWAKLLRYYAQREDDVDQEIVFLEERLRRLKFVKKRLALRFDELIHFLAFKR